MNKTTLLLLKILRMELWNEKDMPNCDINSKEYHSLMDLATKQAVTGIVAQSITDKKLNIKIYVARNAGKGMRIVNSVCLSFEYNKFDVMLIEKLRKCN